MSDVRKRFHCTICPRSFATLQAKERHLADVHMPHDLIEAEDKRLGGAIRDEPARQMRPDGILRR